MSDSVSMPLEAHRTKFCGFRKFYFLAQKGDLLIPTHGKIIGKIRPPGALIQFLRNMLCDWRRGRIIDICNKNYNALRKDPMHDAIDVICNTTEKDKLSIRDPMECLTGTCQKQVSFTSWKNICHLFSSSSHEMIWKFHIINSAFRGIKKIF